MAPMKPTYHSVDDYVQSFPEKTQLLLSKIRSTILENAPGAYEGISYGMPAYKYQGKPLVYFAAFSEHIGFYATPSAHAQFAEKLSSYKHGKGSVQFPINQPIPYDLIAVMVHFRVKENKSIK